MRVDGVRARAEGPGRVDRARRRLRPGRPQARGDPRRCARSPRTSPRRRGAGSPGSGFFIFRRAEARAYRRWHEELSIRSRNDPLQPIATLSGGNQQKVVLARWLERGSPLLVMIEPTRGVDVGARAELYRSMRELAASRASAILISTSDYEEVVQVADRALVMARGRVVGELEGDAITTNRLLTRGRAGEHGDRRRTAAPAGAAAVARRAGGAQPPPDASADPRAACPSRPRSSSCSSR